MLKEINKQAKKNDRVQDILLQFHIAQESSKYGFDIEEASKMVQSEQFETYQNIRICGVMGMATFTSDTRQVREEFHELKSIFDQIKSQFDDNFKIISMGMSGDYEIAIAEGSNMVRIGSSIFGARD